MYLLIFSQNRNIESLKNSLSVHQQQIEINEKELGTPFRKRLGAEELARLDALPALVQEARNIQSDFIKSRTKVF